MIPRYTPAELGDLWSSASRYAIWLEVELAACEAMEAAGLVPEGTARSIRGRDLALDPARIEAIERTVKHDVIAFLTHVEELAGAEARWLHRGMTSSDVLDTSLATGIERLATNVRHWQRTELGEAEERFTAGQKGSSAMPHKRNPIVSENLCGLSRIVRAAVVPALEDVALWHERDISHGIIDRAIAAE